MMNITELLRVSTGISTRPARPWLLSCIGWVMSPMPMSPCEEAMISRIFTPLPPWISLAVQAGLLEEADAVTAMNWV